MPCSNSNLSIIDGEEAATTAKRKEDDAGAVAQTVAATAHREQEALIAVVAATSKTLEAARACECAAALTWEKEKIITRHLEEQLTAAQGITIP
jgi:hypothetical protein